MCGVANEEVNAPGTRTRVCETAVASAVGDSEEIGKTDFGKKGAALRNERAECIKKCGFCSGKNGLTQTILSLIHI